MERKSIDRLFWEAAQIASPAEREAYLDRACGDDRELRRKLQQFLAARPQVEHFLESPAAVLPMTVDEQPVRECPGTVIGPYKLLEEIGEGGFGVVFLAEQTQPVRRKVALKVLKAGMDTRQVVARFEAEQQALAIMDHPHIAKVFDGGATASGRPYFVMELVKGVPITEFCDQNQLTPRQRLELFLPVCLAVQHAHQKGIIHRDLKPSNVLVSRHDTTPVVKVIDFGVAKALGQELTDKTLFTGVAQMVGTPLYMSPEQAGMSDLDVDTRSDIYSLGVLLYELLTGSTPFTKERFQNAGYDEIRRIIREEEPPKPSTRLSESTDTLPLISAQRHTEPARLTKLVRGELDWMVMKALEKDRSRRYQTANGFAMDVQRYLSGEAVQAVPPSAGYRFRKFARRNKRALVMASVIGVALLLAVGSLGWMARDRAEQRVRTGVEVNQFLQRAESLYADNKLPEAVAEVQKARGVLEAGRGDEELDRRVRQWLTDLDTAAKLEEMRLELVDLEDRDRWCAELAQVFREYDIDVEALSAEEVTARVAASQVRLDLVHALERWASQLRFDPRRQDPARWQRLIAIKRAADPDPWRQRLQAAVEVKDVQTLRELAKGADAARLRTRTLAYLGDSLRAAGDAEAAVAFLRRVQGQHPGDFSINSNLASCLSQLKPPPLDEVIAFRRVALAARPQSAWAHGGLGYALGKKDRLDEAIVEYHEAIHLRPRYIAAHTLLGIALKDQNKLDAAIACFHKAIALDPKYVAAHVNLGDALRRQKKLDEAIVWYKKALDIDPKHVFAHTNLGIALHDQKKLDEAIASYCKAIDIDPKYVFAHNNLGLALRDQKKLDEAIACFKKVIDIDPKYVAAYSNLGLALRDQKKLDEAIAWCRKALDIDPNSAPAHNTLGLALDDQGKVAEAIACFRKAIALDANYVPAHDNLGSALKSQNKLTEAIACYRTAIAIDPKDASPHYNLGNTLTAQGKFDEAIAEFRTAIELDPKDPRWHNNLGDALSRKGKVDEAIACFRRAIELDSKHTKAHLNLGKSLSKQGKVDEAIACFRRVIELDPKHADAHNDLGNAWFKKGKVGEAIAFYRTAIALNPKFAHTFCNLGFALAEQKKLDDAIACFKKAIEINPTVAGYYYALGNALKDQNKLDEAIASCKKALAIYPKYADAHNVIGIALKRQNKLDAAVIEYRKAIAINPKGAHFHLNLGLALRAQNKLDEAIAEYREAIAIDPKDADTHYNLGNALLNQNKLDDAVAAYRKAIAINPRFTFAHNNLGDALMRQGKLEDAIACFREAIRLKPDHASAQSNLGECLYRQRKLDDAIAAYREAIRHQPDNARVHYNLGIALSDKGSLDDAIAAYETAICLKPDSADAHINLGNALLGTGRHDDAVAALREGIRLKPKEPNARNSLGWVLAQMGRVEEAIACFEEAIRLKPDYIQPHIGLTSLLTAGPDPKFWDGKRAVELMNRVETLGGKNAVTRRDMGMAHYRAGNWKESIAALEEAMKLTKGGNSYHWFGLALAHQRLGDNAEARKWYDQAVEWMDKNKPQDKMGNLRRFRAEAAKLLGVAVEAAPPPKEKK